MTEKQKLCLEKGVLMLSGIAFLFLTTPAWIPGFCAAAAFSAVLCLAVWKLKVSAGSLTGLMRKPVCGALGLMTASACGVNFWNNWRDSGNMLKIAGVLGMDAATLVTVCAVAFVLAATPAAVCVLAHLTGAAMEDYRAAKIARQTDCRRISAGKAVIVLSFVYVLAISAILRANFYYQDDAGRAAFGYKQWDYFGRFLSTAMSTFVHMGDYLVDIAPMPQILAMVMMAFASVAVLYILYDRTEFSLWELACVLPLALNPYFLECVSFRFDAPYMAASVLGGVLPLLLRKRGTGTYLLASMLGILAVCTSYQAATGIFPILVILLALRMWNRGNSLKDAFVFCLKSVAGYGLGLVYFKLVLMRPADAVYVSNSMPAVGELLPNTAANLKQYYQLILWDFKPFWLGLAGLTAVGFLFLTVYTSRQKKLPALAMSLVALLLMLLLCFGIYPVLAATLFAPRAMYGFGILLALLGLTLAEGTGHIGIRLPALVLSWVFFVFAFTYGNALCLQREYTDFRVELVLSDLNEVELFGEESPVTVQITGSIGQSPIIDNMPRNYRMLDRLIPETFAGGDDLTQYRFFYYYGLKNVVTDPGVDLTQMDLPVLKDTMYHTIRGAGNYVLVELK